jgi:GPH family glycoside/pentoside/hexuronide:cation symporter
VGTALSVLISGFILKLGGYVANQVQGPGAKLAIRLLIGPIPALVFIGAFILMQMYPLDEKTYKKFMGQ